MKDAVKKGKARAVPKKKAVKAKIVDFNDLCTTCNFGDDCVRRARHGQPVLYCEEFDNYQRLTRKAAKEFGEMQQHDKVELSKLQAARVLGLCAFCENKEICAVPKNEGGVWHCEQYC